MQADLTVISTSSINDVEVACNEVDCKETQSKGFMAAPQTLTNYQAQKKSKNKIK